jgi:PST family polysaccharide transporter
MSAGAAAAFVLRDWVFRMASGRRLAANLFTGMLNNIFKVCIQVVMLPLMARLLGPTEMGLFLLAQPMLRFVGLLVDAGIGDSLAQDKSEGTIVFSSAFWGLLVSGITMSIAVYIASFFYASWAHQPRLPEIMLPLTITLFLTCATVIPYAMLLREGNMVPGTVTDFFAVLGGAIVGVVMALNHCGVWAIVCQYLSASIVRAIVINCIRPFIPRWEFSMKSLLSHTRIGGAILGGRLIDLGGGQTEQTQVSRVLGSTANGLYGYSNLIGRFFTDSLSNPMWANLYYIAIHKERDDVLRHYVRSHRLFGLVIFPCVVFLSLSMPVLVPPLLGAKWTGGTQSIMIMVLSSPFAALSSYCGAVLFARREVKIMWVLSGSYALARVAVTFFMWHFGVIGLSIGLTVVNLIYYATVVIFVSPVIGNKRLDLVKAVAGPIAAAAVTGIAFWYLQTLLPAGLVSLVASTGIHFISLTAEEMAALVWLIVAAAISFPLYPAVLFLLDKRGVRADFDMVKGLLQRKGEPV